MGVVRLQINPKRMGRMGPGVSRKDRGPHRRVLRRVLPRVLTGVLSLRVATASTEIEEEPMIIRGGHHQQGVAIWGEWQ